MEEDTKSTLLSYTHQQSFAGKPLCIIKALR